MAGTVKLYTSAATPLLQYLNPISLFRNLWSQRELTWQFAWRDVAQRYQGSQLGLVWSLLSPLLMLGVYTFVFGKILHVRWPFTVSNSVLEFPLVLFAGLILNNVFMECAGRAPTLVLSQPNFVKRVVFPLEILPVAALGSSLILAAVTLLLVTVLAGVVLLGFKPLQLLTIPLILPVIFLSLGAGWWLSALGVFLRDIGHFVPVLLQVLTFLTPVFFSLEQVPPQYQWIMQLHPMTGVVEGVRHVLLWNMPPEWTPWLIGLGTSFVFMQTGYAFFMKSKRAFSDVL